MNCENCAIPQDCYTHPGFLLKLAFVGSDNKAWGKNRYAFTKRTVWVCGPACAVQTMYLAWFKAARKVTKESVEYPITVREFTARMNAVGRLEFLKADLKRDKPASQVVQNLEINEVSNLNMEELYAGRLREEFVTPKGGRPAVRNPNASTRRKRRQRARQSARVKSVPDSAHV